MSINFMAAVTICSDFGAKKIKSVTVCIVSHLFAMVLECSKPGPFLFLFLDFGFSPEWCRVHNCTSSTSEAEGL